VERAVAAWTEPTFSPFFVRIVLFDMVEDKVRKATTQCTTGTETKIIISKESANPILWSMSGARNGECGGV
jgi:hypothetical protein